MLFHLSYRSGALDDEVSSEASSKATTRLTAGFRLALAMTRILLPSALRMASRPRSYEATLWPGLSSRHTT